MRHRLDPRQIDGILQELPAPVPQFGAGGTHVLRPVEHTRRVGIAKTRSAVARRVAKRTGQQIVHAGRGGCNGRLTAIEEGFEHQLFVGIVATLLAGTALSLWNQGAGLAVFAAGLLALASWLLRYDLARHNVRQQGLTRFIAVCLLAAYGWLLLAGVLGIAGGFTPGHAWRDAALHAVALGFIFSMIFGHAPIIFPAVLRTRIPYTPAFYAPLLCLHASLALRVVGGLAGDFPLSRLGGLLNAVSLLLFVSTLLTGVRRAKDAR